MKNVNLNKRFTVELLQQLEDEAEKYKIKPLICDVCKEAFYVINGYPSQKEKELRDKNFLLFSWTKKYTGKLLHGKMHQLEETQPKQNETRA